MKERDCNLQQAEAVKHPPQQHLPSDSELAPSVLKTSLTLNPSNFLPLLTFLPSRRSLDSCFHLPSCWRLLRCLAPLALRCCLGLL